MNDERPCQRPDREGGLFLVTSDEGRVTSGESGIHHSPFTIHHSPFTTHHSPLTTHHSPLTTHHSPFTIHHSQIPIPTSQIPLTPLIQSSQANQPIRSIRHLCSLRPCSRPLRPRTTAPPRRPGCSLLRPGRSSVSSSQGHQIRTT